MVTLLEDLLGHTRVPEYLVAPLAAASSLLATVCLAALAYAVARGPVLSVTARMFRGTGTQWDDAVLDNRVLHWLVHLVPIAILYHLVPLSVGSYPTLTAVGTGAVRIYLTVVVVAVINSTLNALQDAYRQTGTAREISIKSFVQFVKVGAYSIGAIFVVAILLGKTPLLLLSGLGALTAVLLFVFRDPILGFVAGIQLTANKMVARGDWIEMPKYGADGDVLDVSLTTVKVQNWDKTITTVPTYALIGESFKNWRGMQESGGRRIKRALYIDVSSIRFCDEAMLERFSRIQHISEYIEAKKAELEEYNRSHEVDCSSLVNGRRMTNIGTFRAYAVVYLEHHPMVNRQMTHMVRQLAPTEHGLPIEVYAFCSDVEWVTYEGVQADIFDHLLAIVPEFDLRVFQNPSGRDFAGLSTARRAEA